MNSINLIFLLYGYLAILPPSNPVAYKEQAMPVVNLTSSGMAMPIAPAVLQQSNTSQSSQKAQVLKEIHIDLGIQMMFLLEDGIPMHIYPLSTGKATTPTPVGTFQVFRKQDLRISSQAVAYRMPYYLSFTQNGAYGMHALPYLGNSPESSNYWHEALGHIGTPVSHGCVRLLTEDAFALYEWSEVGIPVYINNTTVYRTYLPIVIDEEAGVSDLLDP